MEADKIQRKILAYEAVTILFICIVSLIALFSIPNSKVTYPHYFEIPQGAGLSQVSKIVVSEGFIKREIPFKICMYFLGASREAKAGVYQIEKAIGPCQLARRIAFGKYSVAPVKITIQEGLMKKEMVEKFINFPVFSKERFLKYAPEGYLFPDTYFFNPSMTDEDVVKIMNNNFERKIASLRPDILKSKRSESDIIKMASIIERETIFPEDRLKVAQVLWKRLDLGMALQADATFLYINGKGTFDLTDEDLKINSPYNTYNRVGLPPTPIGNPGIESIKAALYPAKTNYLYFLSDKAGHMYFANTFEGHQQNRLKYLGR